MKGYEVSKGQYVVVEDDELESLRPKASHTIEIEDFVDLDEIDPLFFEQPYYLVPDEQRREAVQAARRRDDRAQQGRDRPHRHAQQGAPGRDPPARRHAVRRDDALRRRGRRRATGSLPEDDDVELTERERTMARQLVESLAADEFEPEKYHDEYREQLLDLIERKAAGEEIVAEPDVEAPAKVLDLVAALEASLAKAATAQGPAPEHVGPEGRRRADDDDDEGDEARPPCGRKAKGATAKAAKATKTATKAPAKKTAAEEALAPRPARRVRACSSRSQPHSAQIDVVRPATVERRRTAPHAAVRSSAGTGTLQRPSASMLIGVTMTAG